MKRILKLLAHLYPSAWQERYGAEFKALLEDRDPRLRDILDILLAAMKMQLKTWNFVRITLTCSILGALIAIALSVAIPPSYISETAVKVTDSVSPLASTTSQDDLKQLLSTLRTSTLDRDFLASLIQQKNLYPHERTRTPINAIIDKMLTSITVRPLSSADEHPTGFTIQFAYANPQVAQQVESELVSRFIKQNLLIQMTAASSGHPLPPQIIRVENEPSLPQTPAGWDRTQKTALGLLTGLFCGFVLATTRRPRSYTTTAND